MERRTLLARMWDQQIAPRVGSVPYTFVRAESPSPEPRPRPQPAPRPRISPSETKVRGEPSLLGDETETRGESPAPWTLSPPPPDRDEGTRTRGESPE